MRSSAIARGCEQRRYERRRGGRDRGAGEEAVRRSLQRAEESPQPDPRSLLEGVYATPEDLDTLTTSRSLPHSSLPTPPPPPPPPPPPRWPERTYLQAISDGLRSRDAARQARLRDRRRRRHVRRRVQGGTRLPGGVRLLARARHAALRDRDHRRRDRRRDHGHASSRGDADRRLRSCAWAHVATIAGTALACGTPVPIVLRLPSGGGFSGGPCHSQNPESSFAHVQGLEYTVRRRRGREGAARRGDRRSATWASSSSTRLYRRIKGEVPDERYVTPIGKARIAPGGRGGDDRHLGRDGLHREEAAKQCPSRRSRSSTCAR